MSNIFNHCDWELLKNIATSLDVPFYATLNKGREFTVASPAFKELLNITDNDEFFEKPIKFFNKIIPPESEKYIKRRLKSFEKGTVSDCSFKAKVILKNEKTKWIKFSIYHTVSEKLGNLFYGYLEDITELQTLHAENFDQQCVISGFGSEYNTVYLCDIRKKTIKNYLVTNDVGRDMNPIIESTQDYNKSNNIFINKYVIPEDRKMYSKNTQLNHVLKQVKRNSFYSFSFRRYNTFNQIENIELTIFPVKKAVFVSKLLYCYKFVTSKMEIEKVDRERRFALEEVERSTKTLKSIYESLGSSTFRKEYDTHGNDIAITFNEEFLHLLGYSEKDDIPNTKQERLQLIHPDDRFEFETKFYEGNTNSDIKDLDGIEFRAYVKNVGYKWFFTTGIYTRRPDGTLISLDGVLMNIDRRKNAELQLHKALFDAEKANRCKTVFLNNMSHDIRTPMNAIMGFTSMAKNNLEDLTKVEDYLNKIETSSSHLLSLINNILDMSRIESGKINLNNENIYLPDLVKDIFVIIQQDIKKKNINFHHNEKVTHRFVFTDKVRFSQILLNFLANAIKFTPDNGDIWAEVIETDYIDGRVFLRISIKDNGIGMSEEFQSHIFEAFEREKSSTVSGIQGSGLGLSIAKSIIDMMGGTISFNSKEGEGTEFIINVSFLEGNEDKIVKNEKASLDITGKKVLVVEDNELNQEIAKYILDTCGFITDIANDGTQAVEKVQNNPSGTYDLIFMDIQMTVMDGYEATRLIRQLEDKTKANVPIIAMTANAFDEDRENALKAGMNGHISKPINVQQLQETIKSVLESN